jgi:hypothetical protein
MDHVFFGQESSPRGHSLIHLAGHRHRHETLEVARVNGAP